MSIHAYLQMPDQGNCPRLMNGEVIGSRTKRMAKVKNFIEKGLRTFFSKENG